MNRTEGRSLDLKEEIAQLTHANHSFHSWLTALQKEKWKKYVK